MAAELYLGMMSGTSMDGIDAALCQFADGRFAGVVQARSAPYPPEVRQQLLRLQNGSAAFSLRSYAELDHAVALAFAEAALPLCRIPDTKPLAIGSHGQTVFHATAKAPNSLQLGDPSLVAAKTGIPVVADFRRADMALGGQGAPLVPAFHQSAFGVGDEARCVVNIGGIANVTVLSWASEPQVRGWDVGPGNALMDEWVEAQLGLPFDRHGAWAAAGAVDDELLDQLLADDFFQKPPPKSTGRDYFNLAWVRGRDPHLLNRKPEDVQRTFCELTARLIRDALRGRSAVQSLLVCGGGARNDLLLARLRALLPQMGVEVTGARGIAAEWVEAAAFAWLAMRRMHGLPGNLPAVTGARSAAVLGAIYQP